jgi:hypothetical protein
LTHLLRNFVHFGPERIALSGNFSQSSIKGHCIVELSQNIGFAAAAQSGSHTVKVGTQQSDINHDHEATCPC